MKIGLVCPYNIFGGGGVQECVLALKDGIKARGYEVKIITSKPRGIKGQVNGDILLIGTAQAIKANHTSAHVSVSVDTEKLDDMLESEKFDVIHFHEPWVPILSRQILTRSEAAHVATFHAAMSERRSSRTAEKAIVH